MPARKPKAEHIRQDMLLAGWICQLSVDARGRMRRYWSDDGGLSWRREKDAVEKFLRTKEDKK